MKLWKNEVTGSYVVSCIRCLWFLMYWKVEFRN